MAERTPVEWQSDIDTNLPDNTTNLIIPENHRTLLQYLKESIFWAKSALIGGATAATVGQVPQWDGTRWSPATISGGGNNWTTATVSATATIDNTYNFKKIYFTGPAGQTLTIAPGIADDPSFAHLEIVNTTANYLNISRGAGVTFANYGANITIGPGERCEIFKRSEDNYNIVVHARGKRTYTVILRYDSTEPVNDNARLSILADSQHNYMGHGEAPFAVFTDTGNSIAINISTLGLANGGRILSASVDGDEVFARFKPRFKINYGDPGLSGFDADDAWVEIVLSHSQPPRIMGYLSHNGTTWTRVTHSESIETPSLSVTNDADITLSWTRDAGNHVPRLVTKIGFDGIPQLFSGPGGTSMRILFKDPANAWANAVPASGDRVFFEIPVKYVNTKDSLPAGSLDVGGLANFWVIMEMDNIQPQ